MNVNPGLLNQVIKAKCERDHLYFTRYFFKVRHGAKFRVNWHHHIIADAVQRIIDGTCENIVINVPPGSSKTEMVVINLIARGLALNPNARFLHISSGDDLVLLNSQTARDLISSDEYQAFWPLKVADDAKAKKRWNVIAPDGRRTGGVYAVSLGGQITGFRAGHMTDGFQGAIIIDDPLKADDSFSKPAKNEANRRLISTVKSRKANPRTPIIVIMQRLASDDTSEFIREGNLPGKWEFLSIPSLLDEAYMLRYPEKIRTTVDSAKRDGKGRFSYWEYKEPLEELLQMESGAGANKDGSRISRFVFASQYQQQPIVMGGDIIKGQQFRRYVIPPKILWRKIYADTAMKTEERNDFSVFECWGFSEDRRAYFLDLIRGKWEAPDLRRHAVDFWQKHKAITGMGALRQMIVEDKASGTGLVQDLKRGGLGQEAIPVIGVERNKDKLTRVMDAVPYIEAGHVYIPENAAWVNDFVTECEAFTSDDSHAHDDQIDPMLDAIADMLAAKPKGFFDL